MEKWHLRRTGVGAPDDPARTADPAWKLAKRERMFMLLVAAAAFLVYTTSLGNGFVTDDPGVILHNPSLQGSPSSVLTVIDTNSDTQLLPFYRPFTYLTFFLEGRLHGFNPFFMHLFNVLLHTGNALLVFLLVRSIAGDYRPAVLAGLLFAVHPIHSESVDYLSGGRNTMLACLFVLLAYLTHLRSIVRRSNFYAVAGALFFFLGVCSKEIGLMVIPIIAVREFLSARDDESASWVKVIMRLTPYVVAALCYLVLRWMILSPLGIQKGILPGVAAAKMNALYDIPGLKERLLNNIYIIPRYLLTIVWPTALSPRYEIPADLRAIAPQLIAGWALIFIALGWLVTKARSRATFFGLLWLVTFWVPVSGIFYFSIVEMADHYLYLPAIGLWIVIADQSRRLLNSGVKLKRFALVTAVVLVASLALVTMRRNVDWRNDITLYSRMVEQYPDNAYGYNHLGAAELFRNGPGDFANAEENLEKALALSHSTEFVQPLLGYIHLQRGDLDGALYYLSDALRRQPLDREARINRGITYERMGRYKEALADYEYYLKIPGRNDLPGSDEYARTKVTELNGGRL